MVIRIGKRWGGWTSVIVTYALLGVILVWVLRGAVGQAADGATTDSGGRIALVVIGLITAITLAIRSIKIRGAVWLAWVPPIATGSIILGLWALVLSGRDAIAWSAYAGVQVLRGRVPFADADWVLRWFDCDFCERWDPHYGPALAWLDPIFGGTLGLSWAPWIAIVTLAGLCASVFVLAKVSAPRGVLVLIIASVGPAWLLMSDRINVDAPILIIAVLGAVFASRANTLWAWSILAIALWIMGTWKYFPFPMAVGLLPVVLIKRGWMILVAFIAMTAGYMWWARSALMDSSKWNTETILVLQDFPAYGRLQVLDRMSVSTANPTLVLVASGLLILFTLAAIWWGANWGLRISAPSTLSIMLALFGTTAFLGTVLISGFGFMYKGAFLLLAVPLLAQGRNGAKGFVLFTSLLSLSLLTVSVMVAYSTLLVTLCGLMVSGLAFGAAASGMFRLWKSREVGSLMVVGQPRAEHRGGTR